MRWKVSRLHQLFSSIYHLETYNHVSFADIGARIGRKTKAISQDARRSSSTTAYYINVRRIHHPLDLFTVFINQPLHTLCTPSAMCLLRTSSCLLSFEFPKDDVHAYADFKAFRFSVRYEYTSRSTNSTQVKVRIGPRIR